MKNISVYDSDAETLDKLCDKYEATTAELIETFIDAIINEDINLEEWGYKKWN